MSSSSTCSPHSRARMATWWEGGGGVGVRVAASDDMLLASSYSPHPPLPIPSPQTQAPDPDPPHLSRHVRAVEVVPGVRLRVALGLCIPHDLAERAPVPERVEDVGERAAEDALDLEHPVAGLDEVLQGGEHGEAGADGALRWVRLGWGGFGRGVWVCLGIRGEEDASVQECSRPPPKKDRKPQR